jgi:hypothetical protein
MPRPSPPRTKVLLVRPAPGGIKSVRKRDEPDRTPLRLAIGVIVAIGVVAAVWLMGYAGFRLGFAPLVRIPQLLGEPGGGLATGVIMLISIPTVIIQAGVAEPTWLMLGFALIAIPAAGISAVKPRAPGGPRLSAAGLVFSYAGAICAALNALVVIWWTASRVRNDRIGELPFDPIDAPTWLENLRTIAGLDVLAVIATAVWVVLVMRLAIPIWMRAITATASLFSLVVVIVAMSMTNAAVAQIQTFRSVVFLDDGSLDTRLVLGYTGRHVATLRLDSGITIVELHDRSSTMTVIGRQSIVGMLEEEGTKGLRD